MFVVFMIVNFNGVIIGCWFVIFMKIIIFFGKLLKKYRFKFILLVIFYSLN